MPQLGRVRELGRDEVDEGGRVHRRPVRRDARSGRGDVTGQQPRVVPRAVDRPGVGGDAVALEALGPLADRPREEDPGDRRAFPPRASASAAGWHRRSRPRDRAGPAGGTRNPSPRSPRRPRTTGRRRRPSGAGTRSGLRRRRRSARCARGPRRGPPRRRPGRGPRTAGRSARGPRPADRSRPRAWRATARRARSWQAHGSSPLASSNPEFCLPRMRTRWPAYVAAGGPRRSGGSAPSRPRRRERLGDADRDDQGLARYSPSVVSTTNPPPSASSTRRVPVQRQP